MRPWKRGRQRSSHARPGGPHRPHTASKSAARLGGWPRGSSLWAPWGLTWPPSPASIHGFQPQPPSPSSNPSLPLQPPTPASILSLHLQPPTPASIPSPGFQPKSLSWASISSLYSWPPSPASNASLHSQPSSPASTPSLHPPKCSPSPPEHSLTPPRPLWSVPTPASSLPAGFPPWRCVFGPPQGPGTHRSWRWGTALPPRRCLQDGEQLGRWWQVHIGASHKPLPAPRPRGNVRPRDLTPAPHHHGSLRRPRSH